MKIAALAGLTALALACTQAGMAAPPDAASTLPLALSGTGPYYTLDIDAPARRLSASPSLSDLRVRNGAGEAMAFAWIETAPPTPAPQRVAAHLYKVPLPPADAASARTDDAPPRQAWIVDTRDADEDLLHLDLALEHDTQGVYTLRIEASDDLQHWRTWARRARSSRSPNASTSAPTASISTTRRRATCG